MSTVWEKLDVCRAEMIDLLNRNLRAYQEPGLDHFNQPEQGWINLVWKSDDVRRAHVDVVDARQKRGLWMMHVCIFPASNNDAPIYGFDVIAGENKITGAFHDFSASSGGEEHPLVEWYKDSVKDFTPSKKRTLPEWAQNIFTDEMIAAGNVQDEEEIDKILDLAVKNLEVYLESLPEYTGNANQDLTIGCHNYYAHNQRQNPHTPKVMRALGLDEKDVETFCTDVLFPTT